MTDDKTRQLENRIDKLESTIEKMMPSRREALKMGGAALVGGAAMSGTASAGTTQVGTIGASPNDLVDIESEDINNADTVTTENLVVNQSATGPFGGGGVVLESGDSISISVIDTETTDEALVTLYSGPSKDVLGGVVSSENRNDFLYTFSDNTTIRKNGTGTSYTRANMSRAEDTGGDRYEVDFLPPALDVTEIKVGANILGGSLGAEVILKD